MDTVDLGAIGKYGEELAEAYLREKKKHKEPTFEESLGKLEEIASELEAGELKLDDAIRKYEEGVKLYRKERCDRFCRGKIEEIPQVRPSSRGNYILEETQIGVFG